MVIEPQQYKLRYKWPLETAVIFHVSYGLISLMVAVIFKLT